MSNNKQKTIFCILISCVLLASLVSFVGAVDYKLLAPLPGGSPKLPADETGFSFYAQNFYWFLLSAAIILALVMLVIGGVEYVGSAGNTSLLGDAKGRILNALLGLLLALASWLILNLINPDLVDFSLPIKEINMPVRTSGSAANPSTSAPPPAPGPAPAPSVPPPPPPAPGPNRACNTCRCDNNTAHSNTNLFTCNNLCGGASHVVSCN